MLTNNGDNDNQQTNDVQSNKTHLISYWLFALAETKKYFSLQHNYSIG